MPSPPTHTLGRILETPETGQVTFDARLHRVYCERTTGVIQLLLRDNGGFVFGLVTPDIVQLSKVAGNDAKQYEEPIIQVLELAILREAVKGLLISVVSHEAPGEGPAQIDTLMLNKRLNNRVLDVRVTSTGAVIKLFSSIYKLAFKHLIVHRFIYITTSSLIDYQVPGNDDYFKLAYFSGHTACLTQTRELHLGQALSTGLKRVFEVHPIFHHEKDSSPMYLTEFIALKPAFALQIDWHEVLELAESLLIHIISNLQTREKHSELPTPVRRLYPSAGYLNLAIDENGRLPRITFSEAKRILRDKLSFDTDDQSDFSREEENAIALYLANPDSAANNTQPTDVFTITHYPKHLRPYNVQPSSEDQQLTNSFDIMLRGQELASGFQAINDYDTLRSAMEGRNPPFNLVDPMWQPFLSAYKSGTPLQGGFGMGLNRFLQSFLGLSHMHETVLFPRDATRLAP